MITVDAPTDKGFCEVALGIEYLFTRKPLWFLGIDTDELIMLSITRCVVGQTFGPYEWDHLYAENGPAWMGNRGFAGYHDVWIKEINRLKEEAGY